MTAPSPPLCAREKPDPRVSGRGQGGDVSEKCGRIREVNPSSTDNAAQAEYVVVCERIKGHPNGHRGRTYVRWWIK